MNLLDSDDLILVSDMFAPGKIYPITNDGLMPTGSLPEKLPQRQRRLTAADPEIIFEYQGLSPNARDDSLIKKAYLKKIMEKTVSLDLFLWLRGSPACYAAAKTAGLR